MFLLLYFLVIVVFLRFLLGFIWFLFGKNYIKIIEKGSRFECGFDPLKKARVVFSLRFFLVIILFLVFEIEVVLLMPLVLIKLSINFFSFWVIIIVLFILFFGLLHEWNQGCLNWVFFSSIYNTLFFHNNNNLKNSTNK